MPSAKDGMTGVNKSGNDSQAGREARRALLVAELERLRGVLVETMDGLAEQVLDQIQATRDAVDRTDALLEQVGDSASNGHRVSPPELHMREVVGQIEGAIRDLPEDSWDDFARACTHLARTVGHVRGGD